MNCLKLQFIRKIRPERKTAWFFRQISGKAIFGNLLTGISITGLIILTVIWFPACEEHNPLQNTTGSDGMTFLPLYTYTWFNPANIKLYITKDFVLDGGYSTPPTDYSQFYEYSYGNAGGLFSSGLWIAEKIDGTVHANLTWYSKTNLRADSATTKTGSFVIDRTDLPISAANWPKAYGAPINADNSV